MEHLATYWPVILSTIALIAWLIKLESKVKEHDGSIKQMRESQEKSVDKLTDKLDEVDKKLGILSERIAELTGYVRRCEEER